MWYYGRIRNLTHCQYPADIAFGIWEGYVAKTAVENMGKNPEISSTLMVLTILGMALVESAAIYWLVVAFDLLWA